MLTIAQHGSPEQENVPPVNFVVNVRNAARNVMANHVHGSAKQSKKSTTACLWLEVQQIKMMSMLS